MYNQKIKGIGTFRYYKGQLKGRKNRFVIVVENEDNKDIFLHFDKQDENFENILRKAENIDSSKAVKYSGYSESEEVILIEELIVYDI